MSEPTILIGMAGYARSGKDTVADMLVKQHGFVKVRFADALKRGLATMFDMTEAQLDGDQKELEIPRLGRTSRYMMRTLGTEWGRRLIHPDVWVIAMEQHLSQLLASGCRRIVISDVRFENEAKLVKSAKYQGFLVRVERPGKGPVSRSLLSKGWSDIQGLIWRFMVVFCGGAPRRWVPTTHVSENAAAVAPYLDATLVNDGTLEQLEDKVINLVSATMYLSKKANG